MKIIRKIVDKNERKPNYRQKLAIANFVENRGNLGKAMIDAGYSEKTAKNPKNLTQSKAFQSELQVFITKADAHLRLILEEMGIKIGEASYGELVTAFSQMVSAIQLLSGRATHRFGYEGISEEDKEAIRSVLTANSKGEQV